MKIKCWDINSQYQIIQYYSGQSRRGKLCHEASNIYVAFSGLRCPNTLSSEESGIFDTLQFYRKIHYLTREFRAKLHAKTDIARIAKNFARDSRLQYHFMHRLLHSCNSTLNTPSSITNQTASLALAMRFYPK